MQNGDAAARVLDDAHQTGFKGAMIGTQPQGSGGVLDDPALTPFGKRLTVISQFYLSTRSLIQVTRGLMITA